MTLQDETTLVAPSQADHADADHADDLAIPLPELTRKAGTRRRRKERRRERLRQALLGTAALAAAVLLVTIVVKVWPDARPHTQAAGQKAAAAAPAASPAVLLAQQDGAGNAVSLMLLVPAAKDKGGSLVLMPPGAMTEVASLGLEPVGKSLGLGGAQRLDATVENLLGASIGEVLVYDDARLTALVQPAGPLNVRLVKRLEQVAPGGQVNVLYEPGLHKVQPAEVPALLSVKGQSTDLDRLVRQQAFFEAWLARMKEQPAAVPATPPGLRKAIVALLAGPVTARVLPVQSLGTTEDGELYQVNGAELRDLVGNVFPGPRPGAAVRPRLQVLNGTGAVGLAQRTADRLLPAGVEVTLTGNAGRLDYAETQIVFYRRGDQPVAERVQKALGVGRLVLSRNPLDVVDVTVIVGRDFQPQ
ncbi:MAG TPA: LCP family protein [Acidimicrobiales bacterium]|jgi:hypothetical protein|nr:LCP family protein [Acidimicrobiales bacterium]